MKKIILFLIAVVSSIFFAATAFAIEGEGTEEAPFLITNQEELLLINDFPDCYFKLMNDIVLEGKWTPLCLNSDDFTGVFDGNGFEISKLSVSYSNGGGLFFENYGLIQNLSVAGYSYGTLRSGIIAVVNKGTIKNCKAQGKVQSSYRYVSLNTSSRGASGGIVCDNNGGMIENSYFIGEIYANGDSSRYCANTAGGIAASGGKIVNCFSVVNFTSTECNKYGISASGSASLTNSFYDLEVSGASDKSGYAKSTLAMKMKKTYTDAGWDFENVWGIDANINDGYPYLLWEYPETGSANAEIIGVTSTDDSLKFISETKIEGEPEISSFGTTFIPLWLFETGSGDVATVEYDNVEHNIQNAQTFGATLTGIPESCKDMAIVGKSFIKDASGNYTWSAAKSTSVNDATLKSIE